MAENVPSTARLMDWLEGRLSAVEATQVAAQVAQAVAAAEADGDGQLARTVAQLRAFVQLSDKIVLKPLPSATRESLTQQFAQFAKARRRPSLIERLLAVLAPPSELDLALSGTRAVNIRPSNRQALYYTRVADVILDILIQPDGQFKVTGQVLPKDTDELDDCAVQILRDGAQAGLAVCNAYGEFTFDALTAGRYDVVLSAGPYEITISPLELTE